MLEFNCSMCDKQIDEPGGLLFSPPKNCHESEMFGSVIVEKYHLCFNCFDDMLRYIESMRQVSKYESEI